MRALSFYKMQLGKRKFSENNFNGRLSLLIYIKTLERMYAFLI